MSGPDACEGCGFLSVKDLERVLAGELEADRLAAFERHVEEGCGSCALLAADIDVFSAVLAGGVRDAEQAEFDARAGMLSRRLVREAAKPATFTRRWGFGAAAAAMIVVAIGLGVLRLTEPAGIAVPLPGGGELVESPMAFSPPPTLRGSAAAGEIWREAGQAYEARRFDEAAALLGRIDDADSSAADAALYRGVALLASGDPAAARESLALARERAGRDDLPTGSIDWHAALAALVAGDPEAARRDLQRARDAGGAYADRAAGLLERF